MQIMAVDLGDRMELASHQGPRPGSAKKIGRFPSPWAYNTSWMSGWILAIVLVAYTCHKFKMMSGPIHAQLHDIHEMMVQRTKLHFDSPEFRTLSAGIQDGFQHFYTQMAKRKTVILGWVTGWMALGILLVLFYIFIMQLLVRKIGKVLRLCEAEHLTFLNQTCDQDFQAEKLEIVEKSLVPLQALRQELRLLMFFSFSVMMVLLAEVSICAYRFWSIKRGHFSAFMIEFTLVSAMIPSVFMSPVLLVQCWTGLISYAPAHDAHETQDNQQTDRTHGIEMGRSKKGGWSNLIDQHTAEASSQVSTKFQLPAFYQKLFWWYANPDTDDIDCLHIQSNYPPSTVQMSTASLVSIDPESNRLQLQSIQLSELPDSHHH
ncbi:hypothetical protein PtA15_12A18 [Puccinia triticina]|nr:uncharacterized protein PtA15_12A18 [Puccinia triticina]WAQ90033.1 hypothetical protein PtA15_12A18 [Puccinia triticina]